MRRVLVSLLDDAIESYELDDDTPRVLEKWPPFVWRASGFSFALPGLGEQGFVGIHTLLDVSFDKRIKVEFLDAISTRLLGIVASEPAAHLIVLLPMTFPEWCVRRFLQDLRRKASVTNHWRGPGCIVIARSALVGLLERIHHSRIRGKAQLATGMHWDEVEGVWILSAASNTATSNELCAAILREHHLAKEPPVKVSWPLRLSVFDEGDKEWVIISKDQQIPIRKYFSFERAAHSPEGELILFAGDGNGFLVEIERLRLPPAGAGMPDQFSLMVDFESTWEGRAVLERKESDQTVDEKEVWLPFLSYAI